jgi:uncharacterized membrane protein YhaH (DUF805 family)
MSYYFSAFKKYANFTGRATRKEFWYFALFNMIAAFLFGILLGFIEVFSGVKATSLVGLFTLATLFPSLAISVRRLHDVGKSGRNIFWAFVPFGGLYLIYLYCQPSKEGDNEFASDSYSN